MTNLGILDAQEQYKLYPNSFWPTPSSLLEHITAGYYAKVSDGYFDFWGVILRKNEDINQTEFGCRHCFSSDRYMMKITSSHELKYPSPLVLTGLQYTQILNSIQSKAPYPAIRKLWNTPNILYEIGDIITFEKRNVFNASPLSIY
jgi:hypothetical protein